MKLSEPIVITPRMLPGVEISKNSWVSIEYDGYRDDGRTRYKYHIDGPGLEHTSNDLASGCQGGSLQDGLRSLLGFLVACGEAYRYHMTTGVESDNYDLFPPNVAEWAYQNNDELAITALELEENPGLIAE